MAPVCSLPVSVLVVTGPSGVGKGTLIRRLLEERPDYRLSVSATTRRPRPGEEPGRDYHFLGEQEFERRLAAGDFLEHALYAGNHYGTLKEEVERARGNLVLEIEVEGARQVRQALPEATQVFIAPPSDETLRKRLAGRMTDAPEGIERRAARAPGDRAPARARKGGAGRAAGVQAGDRERRSGPRRAGAGGPRRYH